jgi:hypothetical protein
MTDKCGRQELGRPRPAKDRRGGAKAATNEQAYTNKEVKKSAKRPEEGEGAEEVRDHDKLKKRSPDDRRQSKVL